MKARRRSSASDISPKHFDYFLIKVSSFLLFSLSRSTSLSTPIFPSIFLIFFFIIITNLYILTFCSLQMLLTTRKYLQSCLIFLRNIGHAIHSLTRKCGKVEKTLFLDSQISGSFIDNIQLSILELFVEIAACCSNLCFGICFFVFF